MFMLSGFVSCGIALLFTCVLVVLVWVCTNSSGWPKYGTMNDFTVLRIDWKYGNSRELYLSDAISKLKVLTKVFPNCQTSLGGCISGAIKPANT